jgi:type IV pilus assembly protein PilO
MALLPQNPRDQKLVVMGILAIGLVAVYQQLVWTPKNDELAIVATRVATLDSINRLAKMDVAKGNAATMKAEGDEFARELTVLRHFVPTSNEVPPLLESISNAARRAGLELSTVAPDGVVNGDQFDTYKYRLSVTGPYHQVGAFLANIGSLPRIISPINLTLSPTGPTGEFRAKKGEQLLTASFGVQTYVAHVMLKPAASNAGQP